MSDISWILDLVKNLPVFLTYVVPGYLFYFVYRYILYKDQNVSNQTTYIVLNSLIISFILKTTYEVFIYDLFKLNWGNAGRRYLLGIFLFSICSGYFATKFVRCSWPNIRKWLKINRTPNQNIWDDVLKPNIWVRIWLKDSPKSYYGQILYMEDYAREPLVVLQYYQFLGANAEVLVDNTDDPTRTVILNLTNFERVEIADGSGN